MKSVLLTLLGLAPLAVFGACGSPPKPELGTPSSAAPPPTAPPSEPTEKPKDPILEQEESSDCAADMKKIPAGTLWMGSVKGKGNKDEEPQSQVEIKAFCMDETEVTVGQFKACVANGICDVLPKSVQRTKPLGEKAQKKADALCTAGREGADDMPLSCVSYDEAVVYCKWKGRRLPTEPEFEYVATSGEDKVKYPWGDLDPDANVTCWNRTEGPCQVKSVKPAAFDLYDIVGNLAEWTSTTYGPYPDPPSGGDEHVVRGASWKTKKAADARGKRRFKRPVIHRDVDLGFRCAKSL